MTRLAASHFPLRHRLFRALWMVTWAVLARWTPAPLHAWRLWLLRLFGAQVGQGARIYGTACIWYPPNLQVDQGAVIGWDTVIYCQAPIHIGRNAIVSQYAHLISGSHDIDRRGLPLILRPIHIGVDAWICAGAMVGPGVTVGDGAVLGARAVAFSDLAAWSVYIGNPAKYLRRREMDDNLPTSPLPYAPPERPAPLLHIPHH
ncbi:hypothetical protein [Devosia soli]|uniref:hypothetical protein n=1 Tax=Devosia soli TaxID=361041 RepID=UPI000A003C15|nr:hypothetical protein [Devosia soli]